MKEKIIERIGKPVENVACKILMYRSAKGKERALFDAEELKLIHRALYSQNLFSIDGKMIPAFEVEFAQAYDVPYAVASTSGTAAIHAALGALDLNPGDEVITAPITDMGTVSPILMQNAIPVFADVDETYNIDPADVERKITKRTRAIIAVHLFGNPCDLDALVEISKRHKIPLIEDCAQAHMTQYKGKYVGTFGDFGCFSFQQSKHMTTGEGGMTITSNKDYYEKMKFFIDKGWARKTWGSRAYLFLSPNYRPTELVGAVGLAQLRKVKRVVEKRHELGEYLSKLLSNVDGITPAPVTPGAQHSYWLYPITVEKSIDINILAKELMKDIWVSAGYTGKPIYLCTDALTSKKTYGQSQCPFTCKNVNTNYEYKDGLCPRAEELLKHLICLPLNENWTKEKVKQAADAIASNIAKFTQKDLSASSIRKQQAELTGKLLPSPEKDAKKLRIGIVGCGQIGRMHLNAFKQINHIKLVAFADTDVSRAQSFANEVAAQAYDSHLEMIKREKLDGAVICTVPSTHRDISLDLLNAGINVLCEKPLAVSVVQAQEMVNKAKEKNLLILTAFKFRFFDEVGKAKELIEKGHLGKILDFRLMFGGYLNVEGNWYSQKSISGGGVIIDNASHAVDLVRYLFGEIDSISVQARSYQNIQVEDTAKLNVTMNKGFFGTVDLSWDVSIPAKSYLEIYGEDGTALLDLDGLSYKLKTWNEWKRVINSSNSKDPFFRQANHFVNSIADKESTVLDNEDGLRTQIVIEAAYESLKKKISISIGEKI